MKVLIGTKNPGKVKGAKDAFLKFFNEVEIEGIPSPSNVPEQPVNDDIYIGAKNRVVNLIQYAKENNIEADYYIAIESGISNQLGKWVIVNISVIMDKDGYESWGTSPAFPVPQKYVDSIIERSLGDVMDEIFETHDLRSNEGGVAYLTKNNITRIDITTDAFVMALTQMVNPEIWSDK